MSKSATKAAVLFASLPHSVRSRVQGGPIPRLNASSPYRSFTPRHHLGSSYSCSRFSTVPPDERIEYDWIDEAERLEAYEPGGYHPVLVDDLLRDRYQVLDKLGFGGYSTIWICQDVRLNRYVALKVGASDPSLSRRETDILRALSRPQPASGTVGTAIETTEVVPDLLDEFDLQGPNGLHRCYAVAPAQGNLREASFSRLFPIRVARALAAKLTMAVALVHSRGFVHGDIHLGNVLVKLPSGFDKLSIDQFREKFGEPEKVPISRVDKQPLPPNAPSHAVLPLYLGKKAQDFTLADARGLVLSDFGETFAPATETRLGKDCNTPTARRAPEVFFEPNTPVSYPSDIWSLGGAIWEILGMKYLFSEGETDDEIVAEHIDVLGSQNFPLSWRQIWEAPIAEEMAAEDEMPHRPTGEREIWPPLEKAFEEFVQKYRRKREEYGVFGEDETQAILDLMRRMFAFRPEERLTIDQVLGSRWMVEWALPELESSLDGATRP